MKAQSQPYLISVQFNNGLGGWEVRFLDTHGTEFQATNAFGEHSEFNRTHVAFYRRDGGRVDYTVEECTDLLSTAILDVLGSPTSSLYPLNEKLSEILAIARKALENTPAPGVLVDGPKRANFIVRGDWLLPSTHNAPGFYCEFLNEEGKTIIARGHHDSLPIEFTSPSQCLYTYKSMALSLARALFRHAIEHDQYGGHRDLLLELREHVIDSIREKHMNIAAKVED